MSSSQDKTIDVTFNLHDRDASFVDGSRTYNIAYTVHTPERSFDSLPILVMCHREYSPALTADLGSLLTPNSLQ